MGLLFQINTGEGKTLLIQMICAYFALKNKKVDVVSSNMTLAERDSKECEAFFKKLGLTVGLLSNSIKEDVFNKNILFGTVNQFCSWNLQKYHSGEDITNQRGSEFLVVDEVDDMMIDKPQVRTILTKKSFYEEEAKSFMYMIWQNMNIMLQSLVVSGQDPSQMDLQKMVENQMVELIGEEDNEDTQNYIKKNYKKWINSAIRAQTKLIRNKNYVISLDEKTSHEAIKIINLETGETEEDMRWSEGLHFFLELKNCLYPETFNFSSVFEHHINFFKNYGPNLVGVSGTLGSKVCRSFLLEIYNVECFYIPTFKQKKFLELGPYICNDETSWHTQIAKEVKVFQRNKRPCLILFESIKKAKSFIEVLRWYGLEHVKYIRSDLENDLFVIENLNEKSIVVSTNLGGRGTDFRIPELVAERGGLHVILTFFASNLRIRKQAFGRAARKGAFGTGRLIANKQDDQIFSTFINQCIIKKIKVKIKISENSISADFRKLII
jgi:preprotein translocase subunit SecA